MIKYFVNSNKRQVIAVMKGTESDLINKMYKQGLGMFVDEDDLMPNTYKAIAKCHPNDEFNIVEGKRVAKEKLLAKYDKDFGRKLDSLYNRVRKFSDGLDAIKKKRRNK